jgi:hypothetical protein
VALRIILRASVVPILSVLAALQLLGSSECFVI